MKVGKGILIIQYLLAGKYFQSLKCKSTFKKCLIIAFRLRVAGKNHHYVIK